jgi:hypothetical protein
VKIKRIVLFSVCLVGVIGLCAQAQEPIMLKDALKAGDVSYYKKTATSEQTAGMGVGTKEESTAYLKQTVTKVEDGKLFITLYYKGAEGTEPMMGPNPYDTLTGKSFDIVIGPDGKEIKAIDFKGKIPEGLYYIGVCSLADSVLKEIHFPDHPVSPGDTWDYDPTNDKPNMGPSMDIQITGGKVTYKFDKIEEVDGRQCAMISYQADSTSKFLMPQTELQPGVPYKVDMSGDSSDSGKGTIAFDPTEGRLVSYSYDGKMDLTIRFDKVPDELQGQMPASMTIGQNLGARVQLIDKTAFDAALSEPKKEKEEAPPPPAG